MDNSKTLHINTSSPYDVIIGHDILKEAGKFIRPLTKSKNAAVICDSNVAPLYSDTVLNSLKESGFIVSLFVFPAGEDSKSISTLSDIYGFLTEQEITRSDLLIALGGGVTGDITGFAAATYLRGVDYVQIPTTFLAQIDSSVGGKTAVNIPEGKNLVGAFKQPLLVLCDIDALSTLSDDIFADGAAEAVKYGVIRDKELLSEIVSDIKANLDEIIYRCIDIKRDIVERDEFDGGERMILNFGHTIGHAIEKHSHHKISHGKAVAMGMGMITKAAVKAGMSEKAVLDDIISACRALSLEYGYDCDTDELLPYILSDKKRGGEFISIVIVEKTGRAVTKKIEVNALGEFLSLN